MGDVFCRGAIEDPVGQQSRGRRAVRELAMAVWEKSPQG